LNRIVLSLVSRPCSRQRDSTKVQWQTVLTAASMHTAVTRHAQNARARSLSL
jgi:hypothetical protein